MDEGGTRFVNKIGKSELFEVEAFFFATRWRGAARKAREETLDVTVSRRVTFALTERNLAFSLATNVSGFEQDFLRSLKAW